MNDFTVDKVLLDFCFAQDKEAWDFFVNRYKGLICNAIVKTLNRYVIIPDNDLVADLFQSIFLSLVDNNFEKLRQFTGRSKLSTWLHAISVNFTIDFLRKQKEHISLNGESKHEEIVRDSLANGNPGPNIVVEEKEEAEIFAKIKNELKPRERLFVELYYIRELSVPKIAAILNTNSNNIYQLNNVIRKKMQEIVAEKFL